MLDFLIRIELNTRPNPALEHCKTFKKQVIVKSVK